MPRRRTCTPASSTMPPPRCTRCAHGIMRRGRFVSRDTYPINFGDPWELNRYGYVGGNPGNYSDPTGWNALKQFGSIIINVSKGIFRILRALAPFAITDTAVMVPPLANAIAMPPPAPLRRLPTARLPTALAKHKSLALAYLSSPISRRTQQVQNLPL
jgi:hypothetical protein